MNTNHKRRALFAAALVIVGAGAGALTSSSTQAAPGDEFIVNGDFSNYDPATGANLDGVTVTDFSLTTDLTEASFPGAGNMYDPGIYAIDTNAGSLHNQWVEQAGDNPKMVLNGFTEGVQTVWQQTAAGVTCDTPGSTIAFEFTAEVANVLPQDQYSDGGANISVYINDQLIGSADLTSNDGTPVSISSASVPAADSFVIEIRNSATVYVGNDFSLDNLSLVQTGDCTAPVAVLFDVAPTPPTCDADGSLDTALFPIDREGYVLSVDRAFDGPGDYTITATAKDGFFFSGEGDPFVRSVTITVEALGTGLDCTTHITAVFPTPTPPTCEADGAIGPFPIINEGYTLTISGTGPGTHTITATADQGYTLDGATTAEVTVLPQLTGPECVPDIGGKTIGFWTNKNGTAAQLAGNLWAQVKAEYPVQTAGLNTFTQAQTFIKNATSSGDGSTMLRAQFFATALNVLYIDGYGAQEFVVPATSAIDGGETVTVVEFLNDIEAGWASLDTKAERTSVQSVLNLINQDIPSELFI